MTVNIYSTSHGNFNFKSNTHVVIRFTHMRPGNTAVNVLCLATSYGAKQCHLLNRAVWGGGLFFCKRRKLPN